MSWLLHTVFGGGLLLLLGWALARRAAAHARRERLGEWAMLAALVVAGLSVAPAWFVVPLPETTAGIAVDSDAAALPQPPMPTPAPDQLALPPQGQAPDLWLRPGLTGRDDEQGDAATAQAPLPPGRPEPRAVPAPPVRKSEAEPAPAGHWLVNAALLAYGCGAALFLGRWLLGQLALTRMLRRSEPAPPSMTSLFAGMATARPRARLLVSPDARVPFSCGLLRPTVVLPAAMGHTASAQELRWVFAHELTHLRRRDAWGGVLFGLAQAVYFYLPWFWWLRRQVRLCQEYIADAAAARTGRPADYAEFLVGWAPAPAAPAGVHGVTGSCSDLFRRVDMLLHNPTATESRCPRRWSLFTAGGLLGLAVLVAGLGAYAAPAPAPRNGLGKSKPADEKPGKDETKPGKDETKKAEPAPDNPLRFGDVNIEDILKQVAPNLDPEQAKQLRKELEARRHEIEKALEQVRKMQGQWPGMMAGMDPFGGRGHEGRLGAQVAAPSPTLADQLDLPKGHGVVIQEVVPGSAAANAGLKAHDVLLELDGKPVPSNPVAVVRMVEAIKAGKAVDAVVLRKCKRETIQGLKLPQAKVARPAGDFGFFRPADALKPLMRGPGDAFGGADALKQLMPNKPLADIGGAGFILPGLAGGKGVITTTFRNDDRFTTRHQEGSLVITVTGKVADGNTTVSEVHVRDGGESHNYASLNKVPERYRDKVKNLIEMTQKGNAHIQIEKP
jgi:hypothetical protein